MKFTKNPKKFEWIYGLHAVEAMVKHQKRSINELRIARNQKKLIDYYVDQYNVNPKPTDTDFFNDLPKGNQKIAALIDINFDQPSLDDLLTDYSDDFCLVALDGVTDPQNLGACIRIVRALGANGILIQKHSSCSVTPLVHKIAAGGAASLPIITVNNLHQTLKKLKKAGVWVVGTSEHAETSIADFSEKKAMLLVLGSEGKGIRPIIKKEADYVVSIPTSSSFPSLNVSMACSILLYHVKNIP